MSKWYKVEVSSSGYVRGVQTWLIEADSAEEAKEDFWAGELVSDDIVRDDREKDVDNVEEVK